MTTYQLWYVELVDELYVLIQGPDVDLSEHDRETYQLVRELGTPLEEFTNFETALNFMSVGARKKYGLPQP